MSTRQFCLCVLALSLNSMSRTAGAQSRALQSQVQIGSEAEERLRLVQLTDSAPSAGFTARSASTLSTIGAGRRGYALALLAPELQYVSNSALPFSMNDGPLWAGRGTNTQLTVGALARYRWITVVLAPQFVSSQNLYFQVIPTSQGVPNARNVWANPFHPLESSLDLPMRFGEGKVRDAEMGQSSLTIGLSRADIGIANENVWWGPGKQNAILLSNNAPGFTHLFVRTRDGGMRTRVGRFDAEWILGALHESRFFDADITNNSQSLGGFTVEWSPHENGGAHFGVARTVIQTVHNGHFPVSRVFSAFKSVGNPNTSAKDIARDSLNGGGADQITSLFARWVLPRAHAETYVEWARFEQPKSLRDLLEFPGHSQGYTLGIQWAHPASSRRTLQLATEATYLEPDASVRLRPVATTYASRAVIQGYANRGQALGAAIGPGASSQFASADLFGKSYRAGVYASRIRWDDATLWQAYIPQVKGEDVSLIAGVRASATIRRTRVEAQYSTATRLDYLYQAKVAIPSGKHSGVDIRNNTLSLTVTTAVGRQVP